ncbi:MAG: type II toxin-antitoxin system HipA family toxin [bacterium]|nr:type II toxin-antitoxin system HipA family toxin [bacterium]
MAGISEALVKLWGLTVGAVAWDHDRGYAAFEFDPQFVRSGLDISPLEMPLSEAQAGGTVFQFRTLPTDTFMGLPGLLADCLPDKFGNRVIDAWLARQGRTTDGFGPVERLCYMGTRGMGALEFEPAIDRGFEGSVPVEVGELVKLAGQVLQEREGMQTSLEESDAIADIFRVGTSAGGARPKAVIAIDDDTGEIRSGQVPVPDGFGYWILKFDGVKDESLGDPEGYGRIEYAYSEMAAAAGIKMTECRLLEENGRAHFMTRRFDRTAKGDKIHMQSLCGIAHFDYNAAGQYGYEQAFMVMRKLHLPYPDVEQLFRRMVFNILARNQDDHTKNIAFLMDRDAEWRLSPAFDVIYAHNPGGQWTNRHQMTVNGKRDQFTRNDLLAVSEEAGIKKADRILEHIADIIMDWPRYARDAGVPEDRIEKIGREHRRL